MKSGGFTGKAGAIAHGGQVEAKQVKSVEEGTGQ